METERIALSQRERDRLKVLHEVKQKHLSQVAAARQLKVTDRQVRRMQLRIRPAIASCGQRQKPAAICRNEQYKTDIHEVKSATAGLRFHDLRHHAIAELAEGQASEQTIRSIAGHVSQKMLEHYSHIRLDAKRNALDALSQRGGRVGCGTNSDTNESETRGAELQVVEKIGGREGIRTLGLLVANEEKSMIRRGATVT